MFKSTGNFDRLLERATSQLLLEPDWDSTMKICDSIRSGETQPKYAVAAIKKKFYNANPHVALYALQVMESCVKNCGILVHEEVATKAFMEELRELVKQSNDDGIKKKVLEMIQNWGMAFRNSQKYRIVTDTLNLMKAEGWEFPPIREAEAMFEADVAPQWAEGEVCHRCRTQFGLVTRQHHCRACGQVFCSKCSSKSCVLPKFGIEKEVRVCDSCYDEFGPKDSASSSSTSSPVKVRKHRPAESDLPAEYLASPLSQQSQTPPARSGKSEAEIREEEELQLALALSKSEAEEKEKKKIQTTNQLLAQSNSRRSNTKEDDDREPQRQQLDADDGLSPELMRYLDRNYWEQKDRDTSGATPSKDTKDSPNTSAASVATHSSLKKVKQPAEKMVLPATAYQTSPLKDKTDEDLDEFVMTLKTQVEIFVNRMKSNSSRGRSIANDSSVQTLFMNTMAMHSQLLRHIQAQEDKRVYYEGLQDKLTQVKDARAALDALREEERERRRREAEEAERLRQIQMQEKLEVMRKKKQEYLQYQRQMALQRMQEQEREMMMRQEQSKQQYVMQQPMSMGMPMGVPMGGMPGAGPHMAPVMYSQAPYAGYPYDPNMAMPPTYQAAVSSMGMYPQGAQMMPSGSSSSLAMANANVEPPPGSASAPYDMQGLASALPAGPIMSSQPPSAIYQPPAQAMHQQHSQQHGLPQQFQPQQSQQPGQRSEAELIFFD